MKFQANAHLSIETDFYFTKGFFPITFHDTFHKIEIPGENFHDIQTKLIVLLPRFVFVRIPKKDFILFLFVSCSSDLVHLYANIKEYLDKPCTCAYIGVCIPKIHMDIDLNILESLKMSVNLPNLSEYIHLGMEFRCDLL